MGSRPRSKDPEARRAVHSTAEAALLMVVVPQQAFAGRSLDSRLRVNSPFVKKQELKPDASGITQVDKHNVPVLLS